MVWRTARPLLYVTLGNVTLGNPGHDDRLTVPGGPADTVHVHCISARRAARRSRHRDTDFPGKNRRLPERWEKPYGFRAAFYVAGNGTE